jgi:8-oxo-dGTP diphosphatase
MIRVTCAVIRNNDNRVLVVQRGENTDHPFRWEFPGGKTDEGETEDECVVREVREELSMDIVICGRLTDVIHDYGHKKIRLVPFVCDTLDEFPVLSEHLAYKWLDPALLLKTDLCEADVFVAKEYASSLSYQDNSGYKRDNDNGDLSADSALKEMINAVTGHSQAKWIAVSACENRDVLQKLFEYSYSSDKKLAFRSSWIISKVFDSHPEIISPYLIRIIDSLTSLENESAVRSFLRILSLSDMTGLDSDHHGYLADYCFRALSSGFSAIAVKAYSMEILYRLTVIYPELGVELAASIRNVAPEASAGITARGRMILKKLADIPIKPRSSQQ